VTALAERIAANRGWAFALLGVIGLLFYLPGFFTLPPTDRDEAHFAEASRQMLETENFVDIRFQDEARYQKPIGIYWLQSVAASIAGQPAGAIWPYRLPSLCGAVLALFFVLRLGERLFDRGVGFVGACLFAFCLLLGVEARLATTDACLLAATLASLDALAACYLGRCSRRLATQFWVAAGLGILLKGPILPLVVLLTLATLSVVDRRIAWLKALQPLRGLPILAVIVTPWLIAIGLASHGGFYRSSLGNDFFAKLLSAQELHGAPPGSYLVAIAVTFWPSGLLVAAAVPAVWRRRRLPAFKFLLAWVLPAWLLMELTPTKLPHYVLPLYPGLALLAAAIFADRNLPVAIGWPRWLARAGVALWMLVGIGLPASIGFVGWWLSDSVDFAGVFAVLAVSFALLAALRLLRADRRAEALGAIGASSLIVQAAILGSLLPRLDQLWLSREAQRLVSATSPCINPVVASAGYQEPSLVFLLGRQTQMIDAAKAAQYLLDHKGKSCALALIPAEGDAVFRTTLGAAVPRILGQVGGINYTISQREQLTLYALP
jgi:4-amino-4-deoxy-L-arabinose transferase-like glycosyltransferase